MRSVKLFCLGLVLSGWLGGLAWAQNYMQFEFDGQKVTGRPVSYKPDYVQIMLQAGGYTNVPWGHLSQETLQSLIKSKVYANPYGAYATPYLNPEPQAPPPPVKLAAKAVERMDRPVSGGLMASPVMWLVFLMIYAANIYAGYEIAIYRQRATSVVCTVSAFVPILGPIIFLTLPSPVEEALQAAAEAEAAEGEEAAEAAPIEAADAGAPAAGPEQPAAASAAQQKTVFTRGQFTFNRRFFETKLAAYQRVVPGEAEKDMVIVVRSSRGTHTGPRLTRVSSDSLTLHVVKGGASHDVDLPFNEISEVRLQHKDLPVE